MTTHEDRLAVCLERLGGVQLPPAPKRGGVYNPIVQVGDLVYVSGMPPLLPTSSKEAADGMSGAGFIKGVVGRDLSVAEGKHAAQQTGMAILATLKAHLGSLNRVVRLVKTLGMVLAPPDFKEHPEVINGYSELMGEVFGEEAGIGARSAVGFGSLPHSIPVEIEAIFQVDSEEGDPFAKGKGAHPEASLSPPGARTDASLPPPGTRPTLGDIMAAEARNLGTVAHTPLLPLPGWQDGAGDTVPVLGKVESLQPIGSYKLRGACNNMKVLLEVARDRLLAEGVTTCSSGNWACGIAFMCAELGVPCTICVPDDAPPAKLERVRQIYPAVNIVPLPWERFWNAVVTRQFGSGASLFPSSVVDHATMAGNGTLGLEILRECPDCDAMLVPYGGGALATGIAVAAKAIKPGIKVFAVEVSAAAPLSAALAQGTANVDVDNSGRGFVDGIGNSSIAPEMFPHARDLLDGSLVVTVAEAAEACRRMALESKLVVEGASACAIAAARKYGPAHKWKKAVCVLTGGNIDAGVLAEVLHGGVPTSATMPTRSKI